MGDSPLSMKRASLDILLDLIEKRTGLFYEDGRRDLIGDRLFPLVRERGLDSFLDYFYFLQYDREAEAEWRRVETALAVNETYFWREFDQIKAVVDILIPLFLEQRPYQPVRIWHAACATGEEPYTMVMALLRANQFSPEVVEITATDFNIEALAIARAGVYRARSFRAIAPDVKEQFFTQTRDGKFLLADEVRKHVHFRHLNLMDKEMMARMQTFDVIFCRNAFIYFSKEAIEQVVSSFYRSLLPGGYLFVSAAESLLRITHQFELVDKGGAFAYKRLDPQTGREG